MMWKLQKLLALPLLRQINMKFALASLTSLFVSLVLASTDANAHQLRRDTDKERKLAVDITLGTAADFSILTKTGVTNTGVTKVVGDIGTSPIAATALTGFALTVHSSNQFSTSAYVEGALFAADYANPTPSKMSAAVSDMEAAYTQVAGSAGEAVTNGVGAGSIQGLTLAPGIYKWSSNVDLAKIANQPNSLTFDGSSIDVWIMQIAGTFTAGPGANMVLKGGALEKNIFWAVADVVTFDTTSHVEGIFLAKTNIVFKTGSSLNGAALAQTAVTLDAARVNPPRGS